MIQSILTAALLLAPTGAQTDTGGPIFPAASGPLTIEISADSPGITYFDLLVRYAQLTGQHITFGPETRQLLANSQVNLDRTVTVPASEVQTFVEHLLVRGGYALSFLKRDGVRLLDVSSLATSARNNLRAGAFYIAADQLDVAKAHPAVLFIVTLHLPNTDVRQVSNSMRTMITDANTQQMLPAGNSNSMVLVGFGHQVYATAQLLKEVDAATSASAVDTKETFEVVGLQNALASELAGELNDLLGLSAQVSAQQGQDGRVAQRNRLEPRIIASRRTNSLLIAGRAGRVLEIKALIAQLDV